MNGDGLPDRIDADGDVLRVRWNLGYRFADEWVEWSHDEALEQGSSEGFNIDGGLGFNIGKFAFAGGVTVSEDDERTDTTWTDLNGDDLPDRLVRHGDGVRVSFNTGGGLFTPPATSGADNWGQFMSDHIAGIDSVGLGGGADLTIPIGPLCPPWVIRLCWIILNPGAHVDTSVTATRLGLVDVDGDGMADSVSSDDDGGINVRLNRTGRTNLLKAVHRPLGATVTLDYERHGNTPSNPGSEWLLTAVAVDDGHRGDGADVQARTYRYEDGRFSYTEREGYGYRRVVETQLERSGAGYRTRERVYDTGHYYSRGLLVSETVSDGGGVAGLSTENTYEIVDPRTGEPLGRDALASTTGSAFPRLVKVDQRWHDGDGAVAKRTETTYRYDRRGNVTGVTDLGEPGTAADDVSAEMGYTVCGGVPDDDPTADFPWTQVANRLAVRAGDGTWLQRREATVPCNYAAVVQVRDHLTPTGEDPAGVAVTDVGYVDVGGQVKEVVGPGKAPDEGGDARYGVVYQYDEIGAEPVATSDSFGLRSSATFDPRLGVLSSVTDPNGATTSYAHDARGRVTEVRGPFQQDRSGPPTIAYQYHAEDPEPWVLARHVDAARPGTTIDTVSFVDGLGRRIQTKRDATVFAGSAATPEEVVVVSGAVAYDALGRPVEERHPTTEPAGAPGTFSTARDAHVTTTAYDVLDRVTELVEPTNRRTTYAYGFSGGTGLLGGMFTVTETDPLQSGARKYTDVRGNTVGVERLGRPSSPRSLQTTYGYDPLQRLVRVTDVGRSVTTVGYDLLGRRTDLDNADTGRIEWRYDLAGNLVAEVTPNLRAAGKQVAYRWDRNRLAAVRYPDASNDVAYAYGGPGASGNGAGRVVEVDDAARTQSRAYDAMGEVVEETSVMKVQSLSADTAPAHTYTTRFAYDTWRRPLSVTYPDGEVLSYGYDAGGAPRSAVGRKAGFTYPYVDRLEYDKFGNQRLLAYGNGVVTDRSYEADTTWLSTQVVTKDGAPLQDLRYRCDAVGNPLERDDARPLPTADAMGGPSAQRFTYDDLYRLRSATGTYSSPPNKRRDYSWEVAYDAAGRVVSKQQTDKVDGKDQRATTYSLGYEYEAAQPHAPSRIGRQAYRWDANGNFQRWTHDRTGERRSATWDEEDRMATLSHQGSTTTYRYTDEDLLAIERGPQGEVEFVNELYTALSGEVTWKNVVVDDAVVATKRAYFDGSREDLQYFLTSDLTESVNLVTDGTGKVFEHVEYFPSGEIWVREHSETFREPYLFEGTYFEEVRKLNRMGVRWYEGREGFLYSADPIIADDVDAVVDEPRLLGVYAYAFDNPAAYVDDTGLEGQWVHAEPQARSPGPLHSRVRAKVRAFVQDPEAGETLAGMVEVPSLVELDLSGDGSFGLGVSALGLDVKHLKHLKKLRKLLRR
ncbi:MAG TPA: toxin TcdB middle/N-terminal domain-containing protein [Acidimicrobiales bacterium]|nr:toxin TcdB middle/N-terminal domain-containing protein [Acidimicrobiales bacterium]